MTTTAPELTNDQSFQDFIAAVDREVHAAAGDEKVVTAAVARHLQTWLDQGVHIPPGLRAPNNDHYVMYPLHVAADGSFSVASAVWNVGQETPVHDHGTWGVIGIVSGLEKERRFVPDTAQPTGLSLLSEDFLRPGDVEVCCTTDQDVHAVSAASDEPCVGIHVYGADIGTLPRRSYSQLDGSVKTFISAWATPVT